MPVKNISNTRPMGAAALRNVERQRQMAQALQGQAMQPLRGGRMAGRVYVPDSPMQGVAKLGQMLAGTYVQNKADEREAQIQADQRQAFATDMQAYQDSIKGTPMIPGRPEVQAVDEVQGVREGGNPYDIFTGGNTHIPAIPHQDAVAGQEAIQAQAAIPGMDRGQAAMQHLINSQNPMAQKMGMSIYEKSLEEPTPQSRLGKLKADQAKTKPGSPEWSQFEQQIKANAHIKPPNNITVVNQAALEQHGAIKMADVYAPLYAEWRAGDKASQVASNITNLHTARDTLMENPEIVGVLNSLMPDAVVAWTNPDLMKVKESVATVVQQNLKAILGGQFTEKEGENLIRRAFNPALGAKENLRRINLLITQMESALKQKEKMARYWEDNGFSLRGFRGGDVARSQFDHLDVFGKLTEKEEGMELVKGIDEEGNLIYSTHSKKNSTTTKQVTPPPAGFVIQQ